MGRSRRIHAGSGPGKTKGKACRNRVEPGNRKIMRRPKWPNQSGSQTQASALDAAKTTDRLFRRFEMQTDATNALERARWSRAPKKKQHRFADTRPGRRCISQRHHRAGSRTPCNQHPLVTWSKWIERQLPFSRVSEFTRPRIWQSQGMAASTGHTAAMAL